MSFNYNADLNQKLDGLDLNDKQAVQYNPKPSLLSSSLANERLQKHLESSQAQHQSSLDPQYVQNQLNDHPEPELLATSVGRDMDGRLIPSSSTISLLSLNNQHQQQQQFLSPQFQQQATFNLSPQPNQNQFDDANYNYGARKSNIRSRNSVTHLNQKRYETYQKLTSPPPQDHSTSQSIPINNKIITPDSPNLDPTSLNGSPSRFWLSSQTPPRSLNNSYKKLSTLSQMPNHQQPPQSQMSQHHVNTPPSHSGASDQPHSLNSQPVNIPKYAFKTNSGLKHGVKANDGDQSPTLNPVQTPGEEPMTPLYLNNEFHLQANYFNIKHSHIDEEEEQEQDKKEDENHGHNDDMNIEV